MVFHLTTMLSLSAYGQLKPVRIGEKVPDITISQIVNSKSNSVKISDFKDKLLIIDFWATWCSPCVAMLPKNDSLQKEFGGKVQFLAVSNQDGKRVQDFSEKLKTFKHINFSSVVNDTTLNAMFPHHYIPYYAWIGPDGKLIATTEENQITDNNIRKVIAGNDGQLENTIGYRAKIIDRRLSFYVTGHPILSSPKDSIAEVEPISDSAILYQSIVSKYTPGFLNSQTWNSTHFYCTNSAILNIYQVYFDYVYNHPQLFDSQNRWRVEVKDSALVNKIYTTLSGQKCEEWLMHNGYNYELIWKNAKTPKEKAELFREDIDRYFGRPFNITADIEKRMALSDVLTLMSDSLKLKTTGGTPSEKHDAFSYIQHNLPLSSLITLLQSYFWAHSDRIIFDETNFKGNVDLELNCKMNDEQAVNLQLAKYGLKFHYGQKRPTDVMVIKDR